MRTDSVFIAAGVSSPGKKPSSLCYAWAFTVVTIMIIASVIPLCREIYSTANKTIHSEMKYVSFTVKSSANFDKTVAWQMDGAWTAQ